MYDERISTCIPTMPATHPGSLGVFNAYATSPASGGEPPPKPSSWAPWLLVAALASWVGVDVWRRGLLPTDAVAAVTPATVPAPRH
jgi:hypothetical protein